VRPLRTILVFWVPLVAWFLVIHNFSVTPGQDLPHVRIPFADKIAHMVEYFVLGVLLIRAFDHSASPMTTKSDFNVSLAKLSVLAIIIALCYGAFDEWFQRLVPGRSCDIFDYLADCAGSLAGVFLYIADSKERRG